MSEKINFSARARDECTQKMGRKTCQRHQKTAENHLSLPRLCKFFVFVPLFPNLFDVPLFPTIFLLCSRVPIAKLPVFPYSPKTPGGPSFLPSCDFCDGQFMKSGKNWNPVSRYIPLASLASQPYKNTRSRSPHFHHKSRISSRKKPIPHPAKPLVDPQFLMFVISAISVHTWPVCNQSAGKNDAATAEIAFSVRPRIPRKQNVWVLWRTDK